LPGIEIRSFEVAASGDASMTAMVDEGPLVFDSRMAGSGAEPTPERPTDDICERRIVAESAACRLTTLDRHNIRHDAKQQLSPCVVTHPHDVTRIAVVLAFEFGLGNKSEAATQLVRTYILLRNV